MSIRSASLALTLTFAGVMVVPSRADAIPPPMMLDDTQQALLGVWQEDGWTSSSWGHGSARRTIAIANTNMSIMTLAGIVPSNDYNTSVIKGAWSAQRVDEETLTITLSQGEGRGTLLTVTFNGPDSFTLKDEEAPGYAAARFTRVISLPR